MAAPSQQKTTEAGQQKGAVGPLQSKPSRLSPWVVPVWLMQTLQTQQASYGEKNMSESKKNGVKTCDEICGTFWMKDV